MSDEPLDSMTALEEEPDERAYWMTTARLVHQIRVLRVTPEGPRAKRDVAATEEPLQIRLNGEPFAVIMRTPGADRELAAGFLLAERVVLAGRDLGLMEPNPEQPNTLDVTIVGERCSSLPEFLEGRRRVVTNSSCGLCGRVAIETLQAEAPVIAANWTIPSAFVPGLPACLRSVQQVFNETGGLHAAGLFDRSGRLDAYAEDVGRHNAVDKVIGRMLRADRLPLDQFILFVSGRTSFEIVQKAFLAGIPVVAAVSAPSSLAIELAAEAGITLLGFVRGDAFNVYSHAWRINA